MSYYYQGADWTKSITVREGAKVYGFMQDPSEDGADYPDGHDHEGFKGGCVRFGHTPETCPHRDDRSKVEDHLL